MPEVQMGSSGSSLDEQVVGSYRRLGSSYGVVSMDDSRAALTSLTNAPGREVEAAYARQRDRAPKLALLKQSGAIGEDARGQVVVRDPKKIPEGWALQEGEELVSGENADRAIIAAWVANSTAELSKTPRSAIERSLARMYQRESPPGTWIELEDGTWTRKR